ncbi:MAG: glycosyltransferase family 2 protein [Candidatus Dormibacteraceae bacterium]
MSDEPLVSVIIVNHNVRELLLDTLRSLYASIEISFQTIVVDNNSSDGSAQAVAEAFPQVDLITAPENLGFGGGNNLGFQRATGRFILLLNPDVILEPDCVDKLADFLLVHSEVGAVGPRLTRPDGGLDLAARRGFPTPGAAFYRLSGLSRIFPHSQRFNRYNMGYEDADRRHEIDVGTAACLLVRRDSINQVGLFDPDFFMYGEDIDLCYRLKAGGWKIYYLPSAQALHIKGASSRQATGRMMRAFHSSMWTFHRKHYAGGLPAFINGLIWALIWGRWAGLTLRSRLIHDPHISR